MMLNLYLRLIITNGQTYFNLKKGVKDFTRIRFNLTSLANCFTQSWFPHEMLYSK